MSIGGNGRGHDLWPEIGQKRPKADDFFEPNDRKRVDHKDKDPIQNLKSESPQSALENNGRERRYSASGKSVSD